MKSTARRKREMRISELPTGDAAKLLQAAIDLSSSLATIRDVLRKCDRRDVQRLAKDVGRQYGVSGLAADTVNMVYKKSRPRGSAEVGNE